MSVIIPVYNAEEFLAESIESVLSQSLKDIEIICVDDGSKDTSLSILEEYKEKYSNFTVLQQKNQYAGAARNYGTTVAQGEYLYYFDCDDLLYETALEELYQVAKEHEADVVRGKCRAFDHVTGEFAQVPRYELERVPEEDFGVLLNYKDHHDTILQCSVAPWAGIVRREFVVEYGIQFPVLKCVNDRAFFIETMARAEKVVISDVFIQNHRVNNAGSLVGKRFDNFDCQFKSYGFIAKRLQFLELELYRITLERELEDLKSWFFKSVEMENAQEIRNSIVEFIEQMDRTPWNNDITTTVWYKRIRKVFLDYRGTKVSVVMPIYNGATYLRECIDSVRVQTLEEIEIICVDDGSTDNSLEILREIENKDMRVQVITQGNKGASSARNKGIYFAVGEYLSVLDADDIFEKDMLEKAYLRGESQKADIVVFRADRYIQERKEYEDMLWSLNIDQMPEKECFAPKEITGNVFRSVVGWSWDKLFRREFISEENIRFQEIQLHNDLLFVYGAFVTAKRITVLDEVLVHQRKYAESLSAKCIAWWCVYDSLKELEMLLQEKGVYEQFQQDYKNYVLHLFFHMLGRLNAKDYAMAYEKMGKEWLEELGIFQHDRSYYYNGQEYDKAIKMKMDATKRWSVKRVTFAVKGFTLCLQEHGVMYTINRVKIKLLK